jgi:hypothetical protein
MPYPSERIDAAGAAGSEAGADEDGQTAGLVRAAGGGRGAAHEGQYVGARAAGTDRLRSGGTFEELPGDGPDRGVPPLELIAPPLASGEGGTPEGRDVDGEGFEPFEECCVGALRTNGSCCAPRASVSIRRVGRQVTYLDAVVRTEDGWRIARRMLIAHRKPLGGV